MKSTQKLLLMGRHHAGKTSMHRVVFAGASGKSTRNLDATRNFEVNEFLLAGSFAVSLYDCGGQESYRDSFIEEYRNHIFSNVVGLVYAFDCTLSEDSNLVEERKRFSEVVSALKELSPNAKLFVILTKIDLFSNRLSLENSVLRFTNLISEATMAAGVIFHPDKSLFRTQIYDDSLWKAWSKITQNLIPMQAALEKSLLDSLNNLGYGAEFGVIFDSKTMLVVAKVFFDSNGARLSELNESSNFFVSKWILYFKDMAANSGSLNIDFVPNTLLEKVDGERQFVSSLTPNTRIILKITDDKVSDAQIWRELDRYREVSTQLLA